jgi:hypothetical protein
MKQQPVGIRRTNVKTWGVVLATPTSAVPGRQPAALAIGAEFEGPGAKAKAIRAAGTNRVLDGSAGVVARQVG